MNLIKFIFTIIALQVPFLLSAQEDSLLMDIANADDIIKLENKNEIEVVSASRSLKKLEDLPVTIYVITRDEILYNGYTSLVDVLKPLPGVRISQPGSGELGEMFTMREFSGNNYTKIMVNGIPIKPSVTTGMPLEAQLPIRQAERIEVIFGPASAVYGADAAAGVINIITKEAKRGVFAEADISLGNNGYSYVNFTAGGKAGKNDKILKYSFYGSKSDIENLNIYNDTTVYNPLRYLQKIGYKFVAPDGAIYEAIDITEDVLEKYNLTKYTFLPKNYDGTINNPEFRNIPSGSQIVGIELKYKHFSMSFENMQRKTHSSIGKTPFLYKYNNPQNYIGDRINRATFKYEKKIVNIFSTTNLSFLNYAQDNYSNFGITFVDYSDKFYQFSASNDIFGEQLITYSNKNIEIVSGLSIQLSSDLPYTNYTLEPFDTKGYQFLMQQNPLEAVFENFGFNPLLFENYATFVQGYYVYKKISFMAGIRHDFNTMYNKKSVNPRGAIIYKINKKTSIRASYGTAYKAPAPNLSYNSLSYMYGENLDSIYYAVIPNKNLIPEQFKAYELGIRKTFKRDISVDISIYQNDIYNQIINSYVNADSLGYPLVANTPDDPSRTFINSPVAETILYGADLLLSVKNIIKPLKLNFEFGLSISRTNQVLPEGLTLKSFKYIPSHTGKARVTMQPTKRFFLNALSYWSSKKEVEIGSINYVNLGEIKGFFDIDVVSGFKLNKNITVYTKIINLFNKEYAGINATGYDIDLNHNPQLGRNIRFGMTFDMN